MTPKPIRRAESGARGFAPARFLVLLAKELRDLLRDRRVLLAAILLPAIVFPMLIAFSSRLLAPAPAETNEVGLRIGLIGESRDLDSLVASVRNATWARGGSKEQVASGELDAVVVLGRSADGSQRITVLGDRQQAASCDAIRQITERLEAIRAENRNRLLARSATGNVRLPAREIEICDVAAKGARGGDLFLRFVPMLLVLVLLSAGAFAAIDLFPGERERGTLETLLVQPLRASEVLAAKYLAVAAIGVLAVIANLLGTLLSSAVHEGSGLFASPWRLGALFFLSLPLAMFVAALLVRIVARARTVREAQNYLLPLALLCLLPPFVAGSPEVPFDVFTAALPLAGPAIAFREISLDRVAWLPIGVMFTATCLWSGLILHGALKHLANEENLIAASPGGAPSPARGIAVVMVSILLLFSTGPFFQGPPGLLGLALPVVVFTLLPLLFLARWAGQPLPQLLRLPPPPPRAVLTGFCAGLGLALVVTAVTVLQKPILPMPKTFAVAANGLFGDERPPLVLLLIVLAVLPAVCEELLYRRFLLPVLLRGTDATKAILLSAALFALHHLSIFRFFPTLAAGCVFGWLVVRTHSFWPAPIAHLTSNALVVLALLDTSPVFDTALAGFLRDEHWALARLPLGLILILLPRWLLYRRSQWVMKTAPAR
jgi:sodium transport system permease protein